MIHFHWKGSWELRGIVIDTLCFIASVACLFWTFWVFTP
jgi:hypothetical protein